MERFSGRTVVVTGGTGALGTGVVRRLLRERAQVAVPEFSDQEPEGWLDEGAGKVLVRTGIDLSDAGATERFFAEAAEWGGGLWGSVHAAGGFAMGAIDESAPGVIAKMLSMNAQSTYLCCREAVRAMKKTGKGGRIVNVAARPAIEQEQGGGMVAYASSKAAVGAMSVALGKEVAGDGILVNAVAPSIIDTPMNRKGMPDADHERWPKVEELAEVMCFLVSPENRVVRSGVVPVYGGS